jgi:oligosaccharide repeat unit polymerase
MAANYYPRSKTLFLLFAQTIIVCLLIAICWLGQATYFRATDLIRPFSFVEIALLVWIVCSWKWLTGSSFDPYMLFVLAAAMFHSGQMVLECLNLNGGQMMSNLFPPEVLLKAISLVLLSFGLLHFGALAGWARLQPSPVVLAPENPFVPYFIEMAGWVLFSISFIPAILELKNIVGAALAGGYFFALFAHPGATGFSGILNFLAWYLVPSALFLLAGSRGRRLPLLLSSAIILAYSAVYLFVGGRTVAAVSASVYAWMWDRLVRPIPRALVVSTMLVGLFVVFPLIAVIRDKQGADRLSLDYLEQTWSGMDRPAVASLEETGGSLMTVCYTLELVPSIRDFDLGASYAMSLLTVIPNLFWDIHPSVAYGTPGNWMLSIVDPRTAAMGGGLGYSFIAESYYNFGWFAPLAIGLLGFLLGRLVRWVNMGCYPLRYVCVANILIPLLWYTRNESSGAMRDILWLGVGSYLLINLAAHIRFRSSARSFPTQLRSRSITSPG